MTEGLEWTARGQDQEWIPAGGHRAAPGSDVVIIIIIRMTISRWPIMRRSPSHHFTFIISLNPRSPTPVIGTIMIPILI